MSYYSLNPGSGLMHQGDKIHSRFQDRDGRSYVVARNLTVFQEFPLLCLTDGSEHTLILTPEQARGYSPHSITEQYEAPDPRCFELARIGIPEKTFERGQTKIQGYERPDSRRSIFQDNEGHWWQGSMDRLYPGAYVVKPEKGFPEIRFYFPYFSYICGPDGELWVPKWRNDNNTVRLAACVDEVMKVIKETGVWGHYYPRGAAMTDPEVAKKEAQAVREHLVGKIIDDQQMLIQKRAELEAAVEKHLEDIEILQDSNAQLTKDLKEAKEKAPTVTDELRELRRELKIAQEARAHAEQVLADAREANEGWDWSQF